MAALGHEVTCYNRSGHHVSGKEYDADNGSKLNGVRIKNVFTIDKKGLAAVSSSFFAAVCAMFGRYDAVHIHAEGPAFFSFLPKLTGKRVIVTVHGLDHQRAKWGRFASWFIMQGERNAVRFADEIIVLSRNVQDYFKKTYDRRTVFIPNGVSKPYKKDSDLIKEKWGLTKDSYVLFLGRIVPEKGLDYLIEAFNAIDTNKKLVIAGGSSDTQEYMDFLKKKAGDNVLFTGFVQGQTLEELYSNAYVYVLPSDVEGMPLSLLEAMSYGNCCLVSDIKECSEVVEDKAVLFEHSNVGDLKEKLEVLLEDAVKVKEYKKEASEFICAKYDWNDVTNRTLKLYIKKG